MDSTIFPVIPFNTVIAARAVFSKSNFYIVTGNQANYLFEGLSLEGPSAFAQKQPRNLAMLYLITIFQFAETLPDHSAIDAIRERVDWKYALHLDNNFPGMDTTSLCEFRQWLNTDPAALKNLKELLLRMSAMVNINGRHNPFLDPNQVISIVCQVSRMAKIWDAFNQALNALEARSPEWLRAASLPHWQERYSGHHNIMNLSTDRLERYILAQEIGADGIHLLEAVAETGDDELAGLDEIINLRQVWLEQFQCMNSKAWWRKRTCPGCSFNNH